MSHSPAPNSTDDELVTIIALQVVDKEYALAGVRALRELLAAHQNATATAESG